MGRSWASFAHFTYQNVQNVHCDGKIMKSLANIYVDVLEPVIHVVSSTWSVAACKVVTESHSVLPSLQEKRYFTSK